MKAINVIFVIVLILFTNSAKIQKKWGGASWNVVTDQDQQQQIIQNDQYDDGECLNDGEDCDTDEDCCSGYCEFDDPDYYPYCTDY